MTEPRKKWKKRLLDTRIGRRLVLQPGKATIYTEEEADMAAKLVVADPELSAFLLAEAQETDRAQHDTAESIQSRAMTLQGSVAIATTLALAAGGILLDQSKIPSHYWRIFFAAAVLATVLCFIVSGVRALGASSRTFQWTYPGSDDIFEHAAKDLAGARAAYAASLLKSAGQNLPIIEVKAGYLNAAVRWFRFALFSLAVLAVGAVVYAARESTSAGAKAKPAIVRPAMKRHRAPSKPQLGGKPRRTKRGR